MLSATKQAKILTPFPYLHFRYIIEDHTSSGNYCEFSYLLDTLQSCLGSKSNITVMGDSHGRMLYANLLQLTAGEQIAYTKAKIDLNKKNIHFRWCGYSYNFVACLKSYITNRTKEKTEVNHTLMLDNGAWDMNKHHIQVSDVTITCDLM